MDERYNLSADGASQLLSVLRHGLGKSRNIGVELFRKDGSDAVSGSIGNGAGERQEPQNLQHRPRQSIYIKGMDREIEEARHPHQHGWQGEMGRQHPYGALLAYPEV